MEVTQNGLDAARNWFISVKEELLKLSCKQSHLDKAVFRWYYQETLEGVILLHVNDFFLTGSNLFNEHVVKELIKKFKIGKRKSGDFQYVGLKIKKEETGISVRVTTKRRPKTFICLPRLGVIILEVHMHRNF